MESSSKWKVGLWILAFLITLCMAIYQRMTGPTYPVSGKLREGGLDMVYRLERSHDTGSDQAVTVSVKGGAPVEGWLAYKRFKTSDDWTRLPMTVQGENLTAFLPAQPAAGKLEYFVEISTAGQKLRIPAQPVVTRFKGRVPFCWLLPHVVIIFSALMMSVRTGLALLAREPVRKLVTMTFYFLLVGGMILGPIVQKYAFGAFWTGFPFGGDLTDNKTLVAFIGWVIAYWLTRQEGRGRWATAVAVLLMLAVYLVPHSVWGSELDYSSNRVVTGQGPATQGE